MTKRRRFSADFKARVAFEALRGDKVRVDHESELHDLHAKIGQLTVERDFLARGFKR